MPLVLRLNFTENRCDDINTPVFVSSHGPDASTRRLVLRALLDNEGTRDVHFERMAAGYECQADSLDIRR